MRRRRITRPQGGWCGCKRGLGRGASPSVSVVNAANAVNAVNANGFSVVDATGAFHVASASHVFDVFDGSFLSYGRPAVRPCVPLSGQLP